MKLTITIDLDNDAFTQYRAAFAINEVLSRMLRQMDGAHREELAGWKSKLLDSNGNTVGTAVVTE